MADSPGTTRTVGARLLALLEPLLHIHDTPARTSAAFAAGVAIGFSPFLGFHTLLALVVAFAFNLNRVALLAGTWVNLPWFMGPYYAGATAVAAWLTGVPMPPDFLAQFERIWEMPGWSTRFTTLATVLRPLLIPYLLGSLAGSCVFGLAAYRATFAFISSRRRIRHGRTPPTTS